MRPTQFIKGFIALAFLLISTNLTAQIAISDVLIQDKDYYLVELEKEQDFYVLSIKKDGTLLKKASTPNFNPTFVLQQMRKALCLQKDVNQENCTWNDLELDEEKVKEIATTLFIDLLYTYANEEDATGQKIADLTLKQEIPAYTFINLRNVNKKVSKVTSNAKENKEDPKESKEEPKENKEDPKESKDFEDKREKTKKDKVKKKDASASRLESFTYLGKEYEVGDVNVQVDTIFRWPRRDRYNATITESFKPERCQIVFEDGFISSIIVTGKLNEKRVVFSTQHPVGVSTRGAIKKLKNNRLYDELGNTNAYIYLGDVICYEREDEVLTKDFSPKNHKVILNEEVQEKELYKLPVSKLFRVNFFSDFIGLDDANPNGLVQIEVSKRLNLNTHRKSLLKGGLSGFTHLTPFFTLSKIEENNRSMPLSETNGRIYATPIELFRYSYVRTGFSLNIIDMYWPAVDVQINAIPGVTFTNVLDSVSDGTSAEQTVQYNVMSSMLGGELLFKFLPEKAWGLTLSSKSFYAWNLNPAINYNSIKTENGLVTVIDPNRWLHDLSMLITIRSGSNNDNLFYARIGIIHEWNDLYNNFAQIQLGYSIYLKSSSFK
jgi:hypothetical protein